MAETIQNAIILNISGSPTSINDAFVDFYTRTGRMRLLAKGINKQGSKNRANLQIGSISQIEYFSARKVNSIGRLKRSNLIENIDYSNEQNLKFVAKILNIFEQIKNKSVRLFDAYWSAIQKLHETSTDRLILFILANALSHFGLMPISDRCVVCQKYTNLCDFSWYLGGFLCAEHKKNIRWNKELKTIYFMFYDIDKFLAMANDNIVAFLKHEILEYYRNNGIYFEI
ncbi:DNA repair protein RecO [Mycoplasmopsis phocirhinis]|uniref:DNA repair protein RecO n=1 Tax=Mycoplasmopsis phocirhinis TaxID=142650 RepID=A0A4P6MS78_9BACT|nr:DNA repair protein RecO [Mycoplasmopsis phocirhinis]QBF34929.1 DNA repair protein RecO [Mycoplasmopsis phocirhinis]